MTGRLRGQGDIREGERDWDGTRRADGEEQQGRGETRQLAGQGGWLDKADGRTGRPVGVVELGPSVEMSGQ